MKPIAYISCNVTNPYEDDSFIGRLIDRFKISFSEESFLEELNLKVYNVNFPFNINRRSYDNNIKIVRKKVKNKNVNIAPKVYRKFDYSLFNDFQKKLITFGIVKSAKLILSKQHKSIRDSCIVVYDAIDKINFDTICSMATEAKYIILLSEYVKETKLIAEYVLANFGVAPIVTADFNYAIKSADFIISSEELELDTNAVIWYFDTVYKPLNKNNIIANDITFRVPWKTYKLDMSPELLGGILCQMEEKDVGESLRYNGIFLDKIKFNNEVLIL